MVTAATTFGRNGLADWIIQRFTAVIMAAYTLVVVAYLVMNPDLSYEQWSQFYSHFCMRAFSFLVLVSIVAHGWIGLWVVLTDYMTPRMVGSLALPVRVIVLTVYAIVSIIFLVWGVEVLWGI